MKLRLNAFFVLALSLTLLSMLVAGCGGKRNVAQPEGSNFNSSAGHDPSQEAQPGQLSDGQQSQNQFPSALPVDGVQPWEKLDENGFVIRDRESGIGGGKSASSINLDTYFTPGVERFSEMGEVTGFSEASRFASGAAGAKGVSYALYRIVLGGAQPGAVSADVNLLTKQGGGISRYYLGLSDYGNGTWKWFGPFSDSHVRLSIPGGDFTSGVGNTFVAVVAYDGARFDVVGIGVNAKDAGDTAAPPVPSAPVLTSVEGGVVAEWIPVVASDIAGYRVYSSPVDFSAPDSAGVKAFPYLEGGTRIVIPAKTETFVRIAAVDVSGNESPLSTASSAAPQTGTAIAVSLETDIVSGRRGDVASLTATGAELYDFDLDGDGVFEITGQASGAAIAPMNAPGIIRPAVRGTTTGGGVAYAAVSLIISVNSRPVASATANPSSGIAPLMVNFTGTGEDNDGTVTEYAWDFDGDGVFDSTDQNPSNNYATSGLFNAKLRVTDNDGDWSVDTVGVNVFGNISPVAKLSATPPSGYQAVTVQFNASTSTDPDGSITLYEWDFDGDGVWDESGTSATTSHFYASPSMNNAAVRVTDNDGATDVATFTVAVHGWSKSTAESTGIVGYYNSMAVVNGNPAIAHNDAANNDLLYTRAMDASGSVWDATQILDETGAVGLYPSLAVISGNPAIAYFDATNSDLKYVRATDADGTAWGTPITVQSAGNVGVTASLFEVNGYPAISHYDQTNDDLVYIRATDAEGTAWGTPVTPDSAGNVGAYTSLRIVNGYPAISYTDITNGDLKFVRATNADGSGAWSAPVILDSTGSVGEWGSLAVVNGYPMVSYLDSANSDLKFVRATNADGSLWGTPMTLDSNGDTGYTTSIADINGYPAISYFDSTIGALRFIRAIYPDGSVWEVPLTIDSGGVGAYTSMVSLEGSPAIAYLDSPNADLKFVRLY